MGTKTGPTYATLTLGYLYLEETMYEKTRQQFNHQTTQDKKNGWKRCLDDWTVLSFGTKATPI